MIRITVEYGTGNTVTKSVAPGTTLGQILADGGIKSVLGYGASVEGQIGGVTQNATVPLQDGMTVRIVDKACSKA